MTTPPMTEAEVAACRERCERATGGPWAQRTDLGEPWERDIYAGSPHVSITEPNGFKRREDAAFCVVARADLPRALDTIVSLRARIAEGEKRENGLREALDDIAKGMITGSLVDATAVNAAIELGDRPAFTAAMYTWCQQCARSALAGGTP